MPAKPGASNVRSGTNGFTAMLNQPENPSQSSSQTTERILRTVKAPGGPVRAGLADKTRGTRMLPAGAEVYFAESGRVARASRNHAPTEPGPDFEREVPSQYSNTAPEITETIERTTTTIGAAHQDKSRELKAAFANMKPVQYVALALILAALPLFYYGWPTPALLCGATGIGMLMFAHLIVSNSQIMTVLLVLGVVLMLVFRAYNKGQLDRWLPDSLDKKKRDASPDQ